MIWNDMIWYIWWRCVFSKSDLRFDFWRNTNADINNNNNNNNNASYLLGAFGILKVALGNTRYDEQ